ncbi:uncharacterized protein SAPINGB_P003702 [Magnusiomyces paraingens]|uniref:Uncharacterized protein n=1 Tax=Magnusiomyces paraingens TaxID=2606893 RepID=A0A5E8BQT1_9ASCO|nr:uncharacterized protein SAPINGB_P003702 [Saprochaete ingens]VVT53693.1 unnamed protein product [Saprochaete ingens]
MRRVHFRKLDSHRIPVLQLYKSILRNTLHLTLPQNDVHTLRTEITEQFKAGRNSMAIIKTKYLLQMAQVWSTHIYNAVRDPKSESLNWIKARMIEQKQQREYECRIQQDKNITKPTRPTGEALVNVQRRSTYTVFRHRMLRSYQKSGRISAKSELDETYLNSVLIPEFMERKAEQKLQRRRAIETGSPQSARIVYIPTPIGTFYFLRYPPKKMKRNLASLIHNHIHTNKMAQIDQLKGLIKLAEYEAQWEYDLEQGSSGGQQQLDALKREWLAPISASIKGINSSVWKRGHKNEIYLSTLLMRKKQKDRIYQGIHERKLKKWKQYDQEREKDPLRFLMHYNVRNAM